MLSSKWYLISFKKPEVVLASLRNIFEKLVNYFRKKKFILDVGEFSKYAFSLRNNASNR